MTIKSKSKEAKTKQAIMTAVSQMGEVVCGKQIIWNELSRRAGRRLRLVGTRHFLTKKSVRAKRLGKDPIRRIWP